MNYYSQLFQNGSTCACINNLSVELSKYIDSEVKKGKLHYESFHHKDYVIPKDIYIMEKCIANSLLKKLGKTEYTEEMIKPLIKDYETYSGITLSDEQSEGVVTLLTNKVAILTGGPGTGKTSVIKCVLYCIKHLDSTRFKPNYVPYSLLAPTGKAARRMKEATGVNSYTILKAIQYNPFGNTIRNGLYKKYIFVDESSMIDLPTLYKFLLAIKNEDTRLYFIGDENQLPSVGAGSVLRDLIISGIFPTCGLVKTFRQDEKSVLFKNISIVKSGCNLPFKTGPDFELHENTNDFFYLYFNEIKKTGIDNLVVLTPTRRVGKFGSNRLNQIIQEKINTNIGLTATFWRDFKKTTITFRLGDPVMQLENREVANGDVGKVIEVNEDNILVAFSDTVVKYYRQELKQLDLAYAISIHKSQGSEYPIAFILFTKEGMLDKNMIYTAITRAKKKCIVFGSMNQIMQSCKKESTWDRVTSLQFILEETLTNWNCKSDLGI